MIQGTTSDAGKSIMVTALCRILKRKGIKVAPFKPQNMALNSAVTALGGEIGRAQAVQAQAAGLQPHTDMNPVLLKPNTDVGAQVIIDGKAVSTLGAREFHNYKPTAMRAVLAAFSRLQDQYDVVIVEGAGSPAEINLRDRDIANMGFAEEVDCPVWLIADIDRGGVFAHLKGTLDLLSKSERNRVEGLIINRFRGDISLLEPGNQWLEQATSKPLLGVIPYLEGLHIESEDGFSQNQIPQQEKNGIKVVVPVLPRISNHTDFDPLRLHPKVDFRYIGPGKEIPPADLIILPGSKAVQNDLHWLCRQGWDKAIQRHCRYGGKLIGICGGFQMLGERLHDPMGMEGKPGSITGLEFLNVETTLESEKQLKRVSGTLRIGESPVVGYEIHTGITSGQDLQRPFAMLDGEPDGAVSEDGQIIGTYIHGLFDHNLACDAVLKWAGLAEPETPNYFSLHDAEIDRLADAVEAHLDLTSLFNTLNLRETPARNSG